MYASGSVLVPSRNFRVELGSTPAPCAISGMGVPAGPIMAPNYVYPTAARGEGFVSQWSPGPVAASCGASSAAQAACNDSVLRGMFVGVTPFLGSNPAVSETVLPEDVAFFKNVLRTLPVWR